MSEYTQFIKVTCVSPSGEEFEHFAPVSDVVLITPNHAPVLGASGKLMLQIVDSDQIGVNLEYALSRTSEKLEYPERERMSYAVEEIGLGITKSQSAIMGLLSDLARGGGDR